MWKVLVLRVHRSVDQRRIWTWYMYTPSFCHQFWWTHPSALVFWGHSGAWVEFEEKQLWPVGFHRQQYVLWMLWRNGEHRYSGKLDISNVTDVCGNMCTVLPCGPIAFPTAHALRSILIRTVGPKVHGINHSHENETGGNNLFASLHPICK